MSKQYAKGNRFKWHTISEILPNRTRNSCRERWFNQLHPRIKRNDWSQEEEWALFILRHEYGKKWSEMTNYLLGRSANAIKNHWNSHIFDKASFMNKSFRNHFERRGREYILDLLHLLQVEDYDSLSYSELLPQLSDSQKLNL